jgi:hypothetical protein
MKLKSDVMFRVLQQEASQDNPDKKRRLNKFYEVMCRERKLECRELASIILDKYPWFNLIEDPLERRELILRESVYQRLPESTSNDAFRILLEAWNQCRYELAQRIMVRHGWDRLDFESRDQTLKNLLQEGDSNDEVNE